LALFFVMDKETLIELLEPTINALGYELIDLDLRSGSNGLVRLFIDKEPAVSLDDCEYVSAQVGDLLDVEDPISGEYTLEVSSPGFDRRLRTREHFAAVVGNEIKVELKRAFDGRRRFRGSVVGVGAESVVLECDGSEYQLPLSEIKVARLVPRD
jgi:ribosome maturation factor RimP